MREKRKENICTKTIHHNANNNNLPSLSLGIAQVTKFQKFPQKSDSLIINLGSPVSAALFNSTEEEENQKNTMLLMPIRLNN